MTELLRGATVAVLAGGTSGEREVSLVSGRAVAEALRSLADGPAHVIEVEIAPDGRWCAEGARSAPPDVLGALGSLGPVDLWFLGLHGRPGEDGTLAGFLELTGQRYTGSGVTASALCMDKVHARTVATSLGLPVAEAVVIDGVDWRQDRRAALRAAGRLAAGEAGCFVKPRCGGSSVGVGRASNESELAQAVESVLAAGDEALVEAYLPAVELTCGVLGNKGEELVALTPMEIQPAEGHFFDYDQKYDADGAGEFCPPRSVGQDVIGELQRDALAMHRALRCDGYSRIDFLLPRGAARPVFMEANNLPGLTPRSLMPQCAAHDGLPFPELCRRIAEAGLRAVRPSAPGLAQAAVHGTTRAAGGPA